MFIVAMIVLGGIFVIVKELLGPIVEPIWLILKSLFNLAFLGLLIYGIMKWIT